MHRTKDSRNRLMKYMREQCFIRDQGCVFCSLGYRKEAHIPIADCDLHFYHGKAYSMCEYHAQFMDPSSEQYYVVQRSEMERILDEYLRKKEDPEPIW